MSLKSIFESARAASTHHHQFDAAGDVRWAMPASTARTGELSLAAPLEPSIAELFTAEGRLRAPPNGRPSVTDYKLDPLTIARAHSRCAAAGALLLVREDAKPPRRIGAGADIPVFAREVSGLTVAQPLPMSVVADGADAVVATALPIKSASIDWADEGSTPSYGASLRIARADYRRHELAGDLDALLTASILSGVGRIADMALMQALAGASLANFSLAAAAAAGLQFGDLRAIAGTAAAGAVVGADGVLRVAGVAAELSDAGTGTYVGAFDQAGVILDRDIRVVADRSSRDGDLAVSVFAGAAALVPDPAKFFKVVA
ncbi:hypothetical protein [Stenotrophomonas acidaminiphila]|uniref:hypothetical protein n=1 Tax=Stenotrophomonas acidaminiphila TaxID=128780 RepID=UPI00289E0164|nr:hypothetical protein [Stenotrophomonas acidaminiphila]